MRLRSAVALALAVAAVTPAAARDVDRSAHTDNGPPLLQAEGSDGRDAGSLRVEHEPMRGMRDLVAARGEVRDIE